MSIGMFRSALLVLTMIGVAGCVHNSGTNETDLGARGMQSELDQAMRPNAANAEFTYLKVPETVDVSTLNALKLSVNGQFLMGDTVDPKGGAEIPQRKKVYHWNLKSNEWLWLESLDYSQSLSPIGMNSTGDYVFGSQWLWHKDTGKVSELSEDFWAYTLRDDGNLLGVEVDSAIAMHSIDGLKQQRWAVTELLRLNTRGDIRDKFWFAETGTLLSSTVQECLLAEGCDEAFFIRWSPELGKRMVKAQIPEYSKNFLQSNVGPQVLSQNAQWLAGAIGENIYLWDEQGEVKFLGGFKTGGTVVALSNDGKVVVGTTVEAQTSLERSWIWTETEGLGWLDEWLRDHGVAAENISKNMQVKLLSADRRVMVGVTKADVANDPNAQPRWWKVDLSEHLRVLI